MTVRKCSTCKYYEAAPIWRKGWCRNPLLYSPQQSHLVGEEDLDCDRGMGNYWEPIDSDSGDASTGPTLEVAAIESRKGEPEQARVSPLILSPARSVSGGSGAGKGGEMSQFGGSGRGGGDDRDDDETIRRVPSFGSDPARGSHSPFSNEQERGFTYYSEDRVWTDYLRIAAPVVAVILVLALIWIWINHMLGGGGTTPNKPAATVPALVASTPSQTAAAVITTPVVQTQASPQATPGSGALAKGDTVVVADTGGAGVNMRDTASTDGKVVAQLEDGTQLTITGDSVSGNNYTWWPVKTKDGIAGFIAGNFLKVKP